MKLRKDLFVLAVAASMGMLTSCSSDDDIKSYTTNVDITAPSSIQGKDFTWKSGKVIFKETNTNKTIEYFLPLKEPLSIPTGNYSVTVEGEIEYDVQGYNVDGEEINTKTTSSVRGSLENVKINADDVKIPVNLIIYDTNSSFVFGEIYVTGSLNVAGTSGIMYDKYFKIYNNSNTVQYADGLALLETVITTTEDYTYNPEFRDDGFATQVIYVVPGTGKEHPVNPGESLIITDQASNHNATNPNALDMSKADFEWYDETTNSMDTDNPEVPNMDKWYSYSASIWTPTNQCNRAFGLAKIPVAKDVFMATGSQYYHDDFTYINLGVEKYKKGYLIPNEWILDAVNTAPSTTFKKLGVSAALDKSYISVAPTGTDKTRFGKSIVRKEAGEMEDSTKPGSTYKVLLDTNDSANDFNITTPSLK